MKLVLLTLALAPTLPLVVQVPQPFRGRASGRAALQRHGGPQIATGIKNGLAWLAGHQAADGHWSSDRFSELCPKDDRCGGPGAHGADIAITGLALLPFLGDGSTIGRGPYKDVVEKAVKWLIGKQGKDGSFGPRSTNSLPHVLATHAMLEAYLLSHARDLKPVVERAVDRLVKLQNVNGGWGASDKSRHGDPLATATAVLALWTAKEAKFSLAADVFPEARKFLASKIHEAEGDRRKPTAADAAMTFVGIITGDMSLGAVERGFGDTILSRLPQPGEAHADFVYWTFGTYAMFQAGDRYWTKWRRSLVNTLQKTQLDSGHKTGSWDPIGPHARQGGRVAATALGMLCLEVYYRYSRLRR